MSDNRNTNGGAAAHETGVCQCPACTSPFVLRREVPAAAPVEPVRACICHEHNPECICEEF